jgi:hypothetical protein
MDDTKQLLFELEKMFRIDHKYDENKYVDLVLNAKLLSDDFLIEESENGNSYAQFLVAIKYISFLGLMITNKSHSFLMKCYDYLHESANSSNKYGQYYYANSLLDNISIKKQDNSYKLFDDAISFLKKSCEQDYCIAYSHLAYIYIFGHEGLFCDNIDNDTISELFIKFEANTNCYKEDLRFHNKNHSNMNTMISKLIIPMKKKIDELKQKILELELRPPEVGGSLYQEAKNNFEQIIEK